MSSELNDFRIFEFSLYLTQIYETETNNFHLNLKIVDITEFIIFLKINVQRELNMCDKFLEFIIQKLIIFLEMKKSVYHVKKVYVLK